MASLDSTLDPRRLVFFAALVVFAVSFFEILDVVELPFESLVGHALTSGTVFSSGALTSVMTSYGYAGLFALTALESASVPIPSEVFLPFAGYLVFEGKMGFAEVTAVCGAAGLGGALVDYYIARRLGRTLVVRLLRMPGGGGDQLGRAEDWLNARGSWSVLLARFVPGIRSLVSLPAGVAGMRPRTFAAMTLVGALGWSALLTSLGYFAGSLWQTAVGHAAPLFMTAAVYAAAIASLLYIGHYAGSRSVLGGHPRER